MLSDYKDLARAFIWVCLGLCCVLASPMTTNAYTNAARRQTVVFSLSLSDTYYSNYQTLGYNLFRGFTSSDIVLDDLSDNVCSRLGLDLFQQCLIAQNPNISASNWFDILHDSSLINKINTQYRTYINDTYGAAISSQYPITVVRPFNSSSSSCRFYLKVFFAPQSQDTNNTTYDFFLYVGSESAITCYSCESSLCDPSAVNQNVLVTGIPGSAYINSNLRYNNLYGISWQFNGTCTITGTFGDSSGSPSVNLLSFEPAGLPFAIGTLGFVHPTRLYEFNYSGDVLDYSRRIPGSIQEYTNTIYSRAPEETETSSLNLITVNYTALGFGWNQVPRTVDYDEGGEPDLHEFVTRHDRTDPDDDWLAEDSITVDYGDQTRTYIGDLTDSVLDELRRLETGGGSAGITEAIGENTEEIQRIYTYGEGQEVSLPTVSDEDAQPTRDYLSIPDASEQTSDLLASYKSTSNIGEFEDGISTVINSYDTSKPLPRIKLPISQDIAQGNDVYLDFNILTQNSDYRTLFSVLKLLIKIFIVGLVLIMLYDKLSKIAKD